MMGTFRERLTTGTRSNPLDFGSITSSSTRSGMRDSDRRSASSASVAHSTSKPSMTSLSRITSERALSSSMIRILLDMSRLPAGKAQRQCRSTSDPALEQEYGFVIDRNPVNDRKPEADSISSRRPASYETTPYSRQFVGRNSSPAVRHFDHDVAAVGKRGDPDPSRCRSMTNGVVDGIVQRKHRCGAVGSNRREVGTELDVDSKLLAIGDMPEALECLLDELVHLQPLERIQLGRVGDASVGEDVRDEACQTMALLYQQLAVPLDIDSQSRLILGQHLADGANGGERALQLMRHARDKIPSQRLQFHVLPRRVQSHDESGPQRRGAAHNQDDSLSRASY